MQIEAVESGTFRLTAHYPDVLLSCDSLEPPQVYLQSSLDGGSTWEDFEAGQTEVRLEAGQTLRLRARPGKTNAAFAIAENDSSYWDVIEKGIAHWQFDFGGSLFDVSGFLKSIVTSRDLGSGDVGDVTVLVFAKLFAQSSVRDASRLVLPAIDYHPSMPFSKRRAWSYYATFEQCTQLIAAPEILPIDSTPAYAYYRTFRYCTRLEEFSGQINLIARDADGNATNTNNFAAAEMFYSCVNLKRVRKDMFLGESCGNYACQAMFQHCSALVEAPDLLPAVHAGINTPYRWMFGNCSSLSSPPACIPDLSINYDAWCYQMFANCVSLSCAPAICCETVMDNIINCFYQMFYNTKIAKLETRLTSWGSASTLYTTNWLLNVPDGGTFIGPSCLLSSMQERSASTVPESWTLCALEEVEASSR